MASELTDKTMEKNMSADVEGGMKTFVFRFKINAPKFASRFGVQLPDDSADENLSGTEDGAVCVCGDAEDADIVYPKQVKATLDQCKAKNPMLCPYHGMQAVSTDIENLLRAAGVNGKVTCTVESANGGTLSVVASVVAPASDEQKVQDTMENFFSQPGVTKQFDAEADGNGNIEGIFDIDMLDPKAQAKWGFGQQAASTSSAQQPVQSQQSQSPAQPAAQPTPPKRTRTRKRTVKASAPAETVESPKEESTEPVEQKSDVGIPEDDAPTLYPGVVPKEPPKWEAPYDANALAKLAQYAERIGKTGDSIDKHVKAGDMAQYLQKQGKQNQPNANLPKRFQKFKNEIDQAWLKSAADKDPDGQVKKMLEAVEKVNASEANGWMSEVGFGTNDIVFDPSKYKDPYAKERAAFENYKPGSEGRKAGLRFAGEVEKSKDNKAPKEAAKECQDAAQQMTDLEEAFKDADAMGLGDDVKKAFAQAYYKANKAFEESSKACKEWADGQYVMKDTIDETIQAMKDRGENVPEEMLNWQKVEDRYEDAAWRDIARRFGFKVADKSKHMEFFKKNMKSYLTRCPIVSYYNYNHVATLINGAEALHANTNSYVYGANAAFGTHWSPHSRQASAGMHTYAKVHSRPLCKISQGSHYRGCYDGVGILYNPRKAVISYVNAYLSSAQAVSPHNGNCSPTFASNPNCNGVSCGYYGGNSGQISKEAFTQDLSELSMSKLHTQMGLGANGGEAWCVGGMKPTQCLAIIDYNDRYTGAQIEKFNNLGITMLNSSGELIGKDLVGDDPELRELVFGKEKKRKG